MALRVIKYDPQDTGNALAALDIAEGQFVGFNNLGTLSLADNDGTQGNAVADKAVGVAVKAAKSGTMCAYAEEATVDGFSGLTLGGLLYLDSTPGAGTQTKPSTNGVVLQTVGTARTATEARIRIDTPQKYQTAGNSTLTSY